MPFFYLVRTTNVVIKSLYLCIPPRESEGLFQYGHYRREADDICAVVQYFRGKDYVVTAVVGHSKGLSIILLF